MTTVIGHRGASGLEPENTVSALRRAVEIGVDLVEFDVRETADGHLVLMHDDSVDRTTDGSGLVSDMTLAEIRTLDAGSGERVPTYEEALTVLQGSDVGAYIEIKEPGTERRMVEAAREAGVASSAEFITGDMDVLARVSEMGEAVGGNVPEYTDAILERAAELDYRHVGVHHEDVTAELVDRIHAHGMQVTAWPVNDRETTERVVEAGVDLVNSDRPDIVLDALDDRT